jgi:predicted kinase
VVLQPHFCSGEHVGWAVAPRRGRPVRQHGTANDWQVVTKYINVLSPLKECTKRFEGRSAYSNFSAIAKIILTFKYLLSELELQL